MADKIDKAREICAAVASNRARWGRHAGFGSYSEAEVLDALVEIHEEGYLDSIDNPRKALSAANRAKGAAEAREQKYKGQLEFANEQIRALTIALEESEEETEQLQVRLQESLDGCCKA